MTVANEIGKNMTNSEYNMLVRVINDMDLEEGKVIKVNGQWYVQGKKSKVPKPIIKIPHWSEGTNKVVITPVPDVIEDPLFETVAQTES
ncbi:MAG: hypothetical protein CSA11_12150 [Chloroflexi bacterium]|nr:MAG: hypothetical protein CSB13_09850 [Chloroflexota bacterium]PIE79367.1 MAG: hypothetical protein CSA11_12150 [Chloroflexota bacterium]